MSKKPGLAIAFDIQNRNKPKKMKAGGEVTKSPWQLEQEKKWGTPTPTPVPKTQHQKNMEAMSVGGSESELEARDNNHLAEGGMVCNHCQGSGRSEQDGNPGTPAKVPDNHKIPESEFMSKNWSEGSAPPRKPDNKRLPEDEYMADHFAEGGEIEEKRGSVVDSIMSKNKFKKLGEDDEGPGEDISENIKAKDFDPEEGSEDSKSQPKDSNEKGDSREISHEDKLDLVDTIRKKLKLGKK